MARNVVGFLSDLNTKDDAVGLCKGLILSKCPDAHIVDISHHVTPFDVEEGARYIADVPTYFPENCVVIAVVFPETGTDIESVIVENDKGQLYVCADNGLLTKAMKNTTFVKAYKITHLELPHRMDASFYGRDILVKTGALLANGSKPEELGEEIPVENIKILDLPEPNIVNNGSCIEARVDIIDKNFGNIWTNVNYDTIDKLGLNDGDTITAKVNAKLTIELQYLRSFGYTEKGGSLAYINSRGYLAFGINQGDFANKYNVKRGDALTIELS